MRRLLSMAILAAVCAGAAVLAGAKEEGATGKTYKVVFDNAFGLVKGGDFRVGGVRAGQTSDFTATKDTPPKAMVTAKISQPGFDDFRKDASCTIKPQSLIGEYYVDCQPGSSPQKLKDGGVVPVEQTSSTIPQDLVNNVLRRPYRERLRLIISELGTGLAGRPRDLQQVLRRAHPGLRETSETLRILGRQNRTIENFIADSDTVISQLENRKKEVSRFIVEAGDTAEISATRREELRRTFQKLPGFLAELQPTMARLGDLADEQIPLLADARRAAPDLDRFLELLGPLSEASRPAIRSLGQTSEVGAKAFEEGANEVRELRRLAKDAPPTFKPLRQFLESLDDRRRATDRDPRATRLGPPASDVSNKGGANRGGFTGLESLWNYFFWQSLSINGYDGVSHMLRAGLTVTPECTPFESNTPQRDPSLKAKFAQCNDYLGPKNPGVNSPDFTANPTTAAKLAREAAKPASRPGERRAPGQPDAAPLPGQRDISKPNIVLPPAVQNLLDRLPGTGRATNGLGGALQGAGGRSAGGSQSDPSQLLDYLLAP